MAPPVIVIFGAAVRAGGVPSGTLRRRVEAARAFGATLVDARYMPTGGIGRHPPAEAEVMAGLLRAYGVPDSAIVPERSGTDTLSSARACAALLRRGAGGTVYVATSTYHLPRCLLLLRLAGIAARACPPPRVPASTRRSRRWFWRAREAAALPYDVAIAVWLRLSGQL